MKRALISVFDKTGIVDFAKSLNSLGWEIISTGGTSKKLKEEGIQVQDISDLTKFPECFDGRVKTLHPNVEGGILAVRDNDRHLQQMKELGIGYSFLTNNPSKSTNDYLRHLSGMGIKAVKDEFYTSAQATIDYIRVHHPCSS